MAGLSRRRNVPPGRVPRFTVFQFRFQLFNCGEATLQVRRQAHGRDVFRDSDGLRRVPQGIFGDDDVPGLAEYDTNERETHAEFKEKLPQVFQKPGLQLSLAA